MYYASTYQSPLGMLTLTCQEDKLTGLWEEGQKYHGAGSGEKMTEPGKAPVLEAAKQWLDQYFAGDRPSPAQLPLAPEGSEFRQAIWRILCEIPYGKVITYGDIAKKIVSKLKLVRMSAQAVGGAVGHNPISIIIPCHRVVGVNGSLTGYAGGFARKIKLLEWEGVDMSALFVPKISAPGKRKHPDSPGAQ
jgi:methylated-DNA-[protein]-cysteine S-methyltransferase